MDDERNKSSSLAAVLAVLLLGFIVLGMIGIGGLVAARWFSTHSIAGDVIIVPDNEAVYVIDEGSGPPEELKNGTEAITSEVVEPRERNGAP